MPRKKTRVVQKALNAQKSVALRRAASRSTGWVRIRTTDEWMSWGQERVSVGLLRGNPRRMSTARASIMQAASQ